MTTACPAKVTMETLVDYQMNELSDEQSQNLEEHFFGCPVCTARLLSLHDLSDGVARLVRDGAITALVSMKFLEHLARNGVRVRRYELHRGQEVACTVAPEDSFVAICMGLSAEADRIIDLDVHFTDLATHTVETRLVENVSYDASAQTLVLLFSGDQVRAFPRSQWRMQARISGPPGCSIAEDSKIVGPYTLNHTPWEELDSPG